MSQTLHQLYRKKAIVLTRTMVMKFHSIATTINDDLIQKGYVVDSEDPTTWKYYLNMAGQYHAYDHDQLNSLSGGTSKYIQIKVAGDDTATTINFTQEALYGENGDTTLANEYRFNSNYYNTLVNRYPEFEPLISGILNPIPTEVSTQANDGEILYFGGYVKSTMFNGSYGFKKQIYTPISDSYQLEENEENLIPWLQKYIDVFVIRWFNPNYVNAENLYLPTFMGNLYLAIPQMIMNIRLQNAKTGFAHSYLIREHLESCGGLGWISPHLDKTVLLYIYRNLLWFSANRGKRVVFNALVDQVLTPSKIPLARYQFVLNTNAMSKTQLYAQPALLKVPLNYKAPNTQKDQHSILEVVLKESQLATDNALNQSGQVQRIEEQLKYSAYGTLPTKVYHSTVEMFLDRTLISQQEIALNLWLYSAFKGQYTGTVIFTNPLNNERIQLTPANAYILTYYCFNRVNPRTSLTNIPTFNARILQKGASERGTMSQYLSGVDSSVVTQTNITTMFGTYEPQYRHGSATAFSEEVTKAVAEANRKYRYLASIDDMDARSMMEWVYQRCFKYDTPCTLTKTITYSDWLSAHALDLDDFTDTDLLALAYAVVKAATGVDLNVQAELVERQTAALAILKHFSGYNVQILQDSSNLDLVWLNQKNLRVTNLDTQSDVLFVGEFSRETAKMYVHDNTPTLTQINPPNILYSESPDTNLVDNNSITQWSATINDIVEWRAELPRYDIIKFTTPLT